jgi:Mn2+/Fe2+ NRAMP family transporter
VSSFRQRVGKPTTAGYVVLAIIAILIVGEIVGVAIGGGTGGTIDVVGGFLIVAFILLMVGGPVTRRRGDDPRDHFPPEPPGQTGLH